MLLGAKDSVAEAVSDINSVISRNGPARASGRLQNRKHANAIPKRLAKDIARLEVRNSKCRYLPYRTSEDMQLARSVQKRVHKHFKKKLDRPAMVWRFLADYVLNLFYFVFLLAGFWFVATQI